jgi:hypothetical protein
MIIATVAFSEIIFGRSVEYIGKNLFGFFFLCEMPLMPLRRPPPSQAAIDWMRERTPAEEVHVDVKLIIAAVFDLRVRRSLDIC